MVFGGQDLHISLKYLPQCGTVIDHDPSVPHSAVDDPLTVEPISQVNTAIVDTPSVDIVTWPLSIEARLSHFTENKRSLTTKVHF